MHSRTQNAPPRTILLRASPTTLLLLCKLQTCESFLAFPALPYSTSNLSQNNVDFYLRYLTKPATSLKPCWYPSVVYHLPSLVWTITTGWAKNTGWLGQGAVIYRKGSVGPGRRQRTWMEGTVVVSWQRRGFLAEEGTLCKRHREPQI